MKYRLLGATGIKVSEIGFGTWGLGGTKNNSIAYGKTSDRESQAALRKAFELGINFFDTADLYGFGHSESLLGRCFAKKRDKIVIASKVGFVDFSGKQNFTRKWMQKSLANSLRRLKTDYLDLYQLHSPNIRILSSSPEILTTLEEFRTAGLIRAWGISLKSPDDAKVMMKLKKLPAAIQVNFNLADQRVIEIDLLRDCAKKGIGVVVRTPLCFGFLANSQQPSKFKKGDHRNRYSADQIKRWTEAYTRFKLYMQNDKFSPAQNALRYCLSFSEVSTVIPGMLNKKEVIENASASHLPKINRENCRKIHEVYHEYSFYKPGS